MVTLCLLTNQDAIPIRQPATAIERLQSGNRKRHTPTTFTTTSLMTSTKRSHPIALVTGGHRNMRLCQQLKRSKLTSLAEQSFRSGNDSKPKRTHACV